MKASLCLILAVCLVANQVTNALGLRKALQPDRVFGSGFAHEQKIKDQVQASRNGLGAAVEFNFTQKVDHFNTSSTATYQ